MPSLKFGDQLRSAEARLKALPPELLSALGLLCIAFALRGPTFGLAEIDWDESAFALVSREILHNHWPFTTIFDDKSIVLFLHYAAAFALFGDSPAAFRLMGVLAVAGGAWLITLIATRRLGLSRRWGFFLGTCYLVATTGFGGQAVYSEHFVNAYALLSAFLLSARRPKGMFFSGFAAGLAINCNYLAIPLIAGLIAGHLIGIRRADWGEKSFLVAPLCSVAGAILSTALVLAPIFLFSDPAAYFGPQWRFMTGYSARRPPGQIAADFLMQARFFLPMAVLAAGLIHLRRQSRTRAADGQKSHYSSWLYGGLAAGAVLAALATGHVWVHYFLLAIAPAFLLIASLVDREKQDAGTLSGAVILGSALMMGVPGLVFTAAGARDLVAGALSGHMRQDLPHRLASLAAPKVREGDTIYSMCAPLALYQLLHTTPPTKYPLYPQSMNAQFAAALDVDVDREVASIFATRPAVVVLGDYSLCSSIPPVAWLKVRDALERNGYRRFASREGFQLFESPAVISRTP